MAADYVVWLHVEEVVATITGDEWPNSFIQGGDDNEDMGWKLQLGNMTQLWVSERGNSRDGVRVTCSELPHGIVGGALNPACHPCQSLCVCAAPAHLHQYVLQMGCVRATLQ